MKKRLLTCIGILTFISAAEAQLTEIQSPQSIQIQEAPGHYQALTSADRAPGDVIAEDDFSDASNWNLYTESGTTPQWQIVASTPALLITYMEAMASPTYANGFAAINAIQYLLPPATELPIDALLEYGTALNCTAATNITLQFFMAYRAFNYDQVFLEVTNNDWAGGAGTVQYELFATMPTNDPTIQMTIFKDISSIAAGYPNVKIRFRFRELFAIDEYGCGYGAMIDDFKVQEAWDYDQELTASYHRSGIGLYMVNGLDYYLIPPSQITDISFSGVTQNLGGVVQPGAKLNVNVNGAGTYASTSPPVDLPVSASDSLACPDLFLPMSEGDYNISFWVDCDSPEEETLNDSAFVTLNVNPYLYSRDDGSGGSSISNVNTNLNNPLVIGNVMDIFGNDTIVAVDIVMANYPGNIGKEIYAQVMLYDEGTGAFVFVDQTIDHTIVSGENGQSITLEFEDPIIVSEGETILVLAGHYGGASEPRFRMAQAVQEQTVLGYIFGATDPFFLANPSAIMVRPRFGYEPIDDSGIDDNAAENVAYSVYPNPAQSSTLLTFTLNTTSSINISITDITGKEIYTLNLGQLTPGNYSQFINLNDVASGTYLLTLSGDDFNETGKISVQK